MRTVSRSANHSTVTVGMNRFKSRHVAMMGKVSLDFSG
jgi:hypothetical protein